MIIRRQRIPVSDQLAPPVEEVVGEPLAGSSVRCSRWPKRGNTARAAGEKVLPKFDQPNLPGCEKVYAKTRSGWHAHVGFRRNHPWWRQELELAEERKKQFAAEFLDFFR